MAIVHLSLTATPGKPYAQSSTKAIQVEFLGTGTVISALSRASPRQLVVSFNGTGSLTAALVGAQSAGNTLQLTQSLTTTNILDQVIEHTLQLTHSISGTGLAVEISASNSIELTQEAVAGKNKDIVADNTLNLTHIIIESRPVTSVLNLTHEITGGIFFLGEDVTSVLNLIQQISIEGKVQFIVAFNGSGQLQAALNSMDNSSLTSTLNLTHLAVATKLETFMSLQSPFNGPERVITLPKPLLNNTENIISDMLLKKSMNGTKRTYIKTSNSRRLTYTFSMARDKGLELQEFFKFHNSDNMRLITWEAEIWKVNLITNPLDFNQPRRGALCGPQVEIDLEFEGIKLSG